MTGKLFLPSAEGLLAYTELATNLLNRRTRLGLLQCKGNLLIREF
jgi:hypothetical protein